MNMKLASIDKIVAGVFMAFPGIACRIMAFLWYAEIHQYETGRLRPIEPANFVDASNQPVKFTVKLYTWKKCLLRTKSLSQMI
jgi:hypothetical protein